MLSNKKIAIYIRVGCVDEESTLTDFQNLQKERLITYCNAKRIKDYELYVDNGYVGNTFERPAMKRLIQDIKTEKISQCIVCSLDRLARSEREVLHLINDVFIPHNVELISLNDGLDTSTPVGKFTINMYSNIINKTMKERSQRVKE